MRKIKPRPDASLGITNSLKISKLVDKEIEPIIREIEKRLKIVAKKNHLKINGLIYIYEV